jgi:hypothetical protein
MNTTVRKLVVASGLAFAATFAQAAPVQSSWDFLVDVKWVDATFSGGNNGLTKEQGFSSDVIQWGSTASVDYKNVNISTGNARSALEISRSPSVGSLYTNSGNSNVNLFTHYNSTIANDYRTLTNATFQVKVDLVLPNGTKVETLTKEFQVYFRETPNTGRTDCAWGLCDNDVFAIVSSPNLTSKFNYDGQEYTLNYFESSKVINPLTKDICFGAGIAKNTACYGFTTAEKSITQAQFALSVTADVSAVPSIPEPETYAMLLAGLGMIGAVARRRRNMR